MTKNRRTPLRRRALLGAILLTVSALAHATPAPSAADPAMREDLRMAMRRFFHDRLRATLALSDEQMTHIQPLLEQLEESRLASQREKRQTMRQLREGMEHGAADEDLQTWLDRFEEIEREAMNGEMATMAEVDEVLRVRQRVQLRMFINQFRQRIRERMDGADRGKMGDRRPPRGRRQGRGGP